MKDPQETANEYQLQMRRAEMPLRLAQAIGSSVVFGILVITGGCYMERKLHVDAGHCEYSQPVTSMNGVYYEKLWIPCRDVSTQDVRLEK